MHRRFTISILLFTLLVASLIAPVAYAISYHPWANEVVPKLTSNVSSPQNALHAPNGQYAQISVKTGVLTVDLGKGEEGLRGLMIYHQGLDAFAPTTIKVEFLDQNFKSLYSTQTRLAAGEGPMKTFVNFGPASINTRYRYVRFSFTAKTVQLDAIQVMNVSSDQ